MLKVLIWILFNEKQSFHWKSNVQHVRQRLIYIQFQSCKYTFYLEQQNPNNCCTTKWNMTIIRNTLSMAVKYGIKHPINIGRNHKHRHKPRIIIITEFPAFFTISQALSTDDDRSRTKRCVSFPWWCGSVVAMVLVHCPLPRVGATGTIFTNHDSSNIINSHFTLHVGF